MINCDYPNCDYLTGWLRRQVSVWLFILMAGVVVLPAAAQVSGINYTISPLGARVLWDDDAALSNGYLYGGELGLGFGEFFEFGGLFLTGRDFETDFSDLSGNDQAVLDALAALEAREVRVQRYGGKLRINLSRGNIVPFVTAGTGILRFKPDGLEESENIYLNAGVGVTFSLADRYTVSVAAENLAYRYNTGRTLLSQEELDEVGLTLDSFNQHTVYNPAVSASLKFYLGGRGEGELTDVDRALMRQFRGGGFSLAVEPFYGQVQFSSDLNFPSSQALAGVNAGFDLGPYIGVRGFYWRATQEEKMFEDGFPSDFADLELYGGEMHLRFASRFGRITPYFVLGGGYLNVGSAYEEFSGVRPESRYFAIGGGGVELPLTPSVRLQGSVRGLFMSTQDVEDLSEPSNVHVSPMYSVGINFNLGGSGRTTGEVLEHEMAERRASEQERDEALRVRLAALQVRLDSLEAVQRDRMMMPSEAQRPMLRGDTLVVREAAATSLTGETLTIPIPERGEIYIRFGSTSDAFAGSVYNRPAVLPDTMAQAVTIPDDSTALVTGLTPSQVRQIVRQALAEQPVQQTDTRDLEAALQDMEARLERQIDIQTNRLRNELREQPSEVRVVQEGGVRRPDTTAAQPASNDLLTTFQQRQFVGLQPLVGVRIGEGDEQVLLGVRADYRFPGKRYRFLPEAELALSEDGGVGFGLLGNVAYPLGSLLDQIQPYAGAGLGFVSDSGLSGLDLSLNLLGGVEYTRPGGLTIFGEYSTLDFFDFHRLLFGFRWRF